MKKKTGDNVADQIDSLLTTIVTEGYAADNNKEILVLDETSLQIKEQVYRLVENYRDGFDIVAFEKRYQDYFEKFDFIVGDWGYEQLRLRGFYQVQQKKVPRDQMIDYLEDYLNEYCNFGCAYFVIAKQEALIKFNQIQQGLTPRRNKRPSRPSINTLTQDEIPIKKNHNKKGKHLKQETNVDKTDHFHFKQTKTEPAPPKSKSNKGQNAPVQRIKHFVIKQLEK